MGKLSYQVITKKNIYDICKLSRTLSKEQKKCVADNSFSIAEGSVYNNAYYRGVYLDNTPIGFFMVFIPDEISMKEKDGKDFYLWRFMIAGEHQKKHYGTEVLDHIVKLAKEKGFKEIVTSCHMGEVSPYDFYIRYGFVDTGKFEDEEEVLILEIK